MPTDVQKRRRSEIFCAMDQVRKFSKCLLRISRPNLKESELDTVADKIVLITQDQLQKSTSPKANDGTTKNKIEAIISSIQDQECQNFGMTKNSTVAVSGSKDTSKTTNDIKAINAHSTQKEINKTGFKKFAATTKRIIRGGKVPYKELQDENSKIKKPSQKDALKTNLKKSKITEETQRTPFTRKSTLMKSILPQNKTKEKSNSNRIKESLFKDMKNEVKESSPNDDKLDMDKFKEFIKKKMGLKSPICPRYFKTLLETYKTNGKVLFSKEEPDKKVTGDFVRSKSARAGKITEDKSSERVSLSRLHRLSLRAQTSKVKNDLHKAPQSKAEISAAMPSSSHPKTSSFLSSTPNNDNCLTRDSHLEKRNVSLIPLPTPKKSEHKNSVKKPLPFSNIGKLEGADKKSRASEQRSQTFIIEKEQKNTLHCQPQINRPKIVKPVSKIPRPRHSIRKSNVLNSLGDSKKIEDKFSTEKSNALNISQLCSEFSKLDMASTSSPYKDAKIKESLDQFWPKVTIISKPLRDEHGEVKKNGEIMERQTVKDVKFIPKRLIFGDRSLVQDTSSSILGERTNETFHSNEKPKKTNSTGKENNVYFYAEKMLVRCYCKSPRFHESRYEEFDDFSFSLVSSPAPEERSDQLQFDDINGDIVFVDVFRGESNTLNLIYESQKKVLRVMEELLSIQARLNALKLKLSKPVLRYYYVL